MHIPGEESEDKLKNKAPGSQTFVGRDLYIQNKVLPTFVRSEENISDGLTKNQPAQLFVEHENVLLNGILPYRREDVEETLDLEASNNERSTYQDSVRIDSGQKDRHGHRGPDSPD